MNDPKVISLHYRFESRQKNDRFDEAAPLFDKLGDFDVFLDGGLLIAEPEKHYPSEETARSALEPMLRDWEASAFLDPGRYWIRFAFQNAEIVDLAPDRGSTTILAVSIVGEASVAGGVEVVRSNSAYPPPRQDVRCDRLMDELLVRLRQYRERRELLPAMAYFVLDRIEHEYEHSTGKTRRGKAATALSIDPEMLDRLGELTARHDPRIGRKAEGAPRPLTGKETTWIEAAVELLILRVGQLASGSGSPAQITMADLPSL